MKHKCDRCNRPATHHSVEIIGGKKIEKHLCDIHAAEEGLTVSPAHKPIDELLTSFVKQQATGETTPKKRVAACEHCNTTWESFREKSLLGCPRCYGSFEAQLGTLLERAHEGGSHHVGKVPRRAGASEARQVQLTRMRQKLEEAVTAEDYELAARLRDDIRQIEETA